MKNAIIKYLGISLLLALGLTSCKKFLDEKSDKKLVELKTLDDLQSLLDNYDFQNRETTPGFGETSADDYFLKLADFNSLTQNLDRQAYTWEVSDYVFSNDWSNGYRGVYPANYCLDYIDKIARTATNSEQWNNVKGSALFHRAYRYLNLVWVYGKAYDENTSQNDLGIVLRLNSDPSNPSVRASVKASYERVIVDAEESIMYLPNLPQHIMRPSKAAAYGLLARAYLSMRNYDNAYKFANLALEVKSELLDYNSSEIRPTNSRPFPQFNKEIIFYTTQTQNYFPKNPFISYIDTTLYNSYNSNDWRKTAFFLLRSNYYAFKGTYSRVSMEDLFTGIATDELYLIRAECYARKDNKDAALQDLNTLLIKRWKTGTFMPVTASSPHEALNIILIERRKELLMRGLRWIDIKRLNKEGRNIVPKRIIAGQSFALPINDNRYALPLPEDIIKITGMPQNPR